jgi:hypothetical protein
MRRNVVRTLAALMLAAAVLVPATGSVAAAGNGATTQSNAGPPRCC